MTTREIIQILTTFGWALLCGLLIFVVPLSWRRAFTSDTLLHRILYSLLCLVCAVGFSLCAWYLWNYRVPKEEPAPPPATTSLPASLPPSTPAP